MLAELHPSAHLLCGLLSGDPSPARPTAALALELAGASVVDAGARERIGPDGPLVRLGLVVLEGDDVLLARRLRLPDRVVARLLGSHRATADVAAVLVDAEPVDLDGSADVAAALRVGEPLVWVHSPVGAAGTALAVAACREVDVTCLVGDLERLPVATGAGTDPALVRRTVRALVLEAGLGGTVLVLAGMDTNADPQSVYEDLKKKLKPVTGVVSNVADAWTETGELADQRNAQAKTGKLGDNTKAGRRLAWHIQKMFSASKRGKLQQKTKVLAAATSAAAANGS